MSNIMYFYNKVNKESRLLFTQVGPSIVQNYVDINGVYFFKNWVISDSAAPQTAACQAFLSITIS